MTFLFRKTKIVFFAAIGITCLIVFYSYLPIKVVNEFGAEAFYYGIFAQNGEVQSPVVVFGLIHIFLAALPFGLILGFIIEFYANIEHKKLLVVLYDNCDYIRFINLYQPILQRETRRLVLKSPLTCAVELHYARALFLSGDTKSSIQMLEAILSKKRTKGKRWAALKTSALFSLTLFYYFEGDLAKVLSCYDKEDLGPKGRSKVRLSDSTRATVALILNEEYKEAEKVITVVLEKKILALERFYLNCLLSRIYLEMGNGNKAMECLDFAEKMAPESYPVLQIRNELINLES